MYEHEKLLKELEKLPWKAGMLVVGASFLVATMISNAVSFVMMPNAPQLQRSRMPASVDAGLPGGNITLSDSDIKVICDRNLFNKEEKCPGLGTETSDEELQSGTLVKSDLPLKVVGIIYGGTPFTGLATIMNSSKNKINSFIVGDRLMKGAEVVEIHRLRVILLRDGRREYLELDQKDIVRSRRKKDKKAPPMTSSAIAPIAKGPPPKIYKEDGFEREGNEMVMSKDYKQKLLTTDFSKVLQDAKATPNMTGGQVKGFKLTRIREGSIYQKAGLQNGDVVEEINGVPLNNPAAAIRLLQSLRNESEIDLMVNRNGSSFPMNLSVR